jgi:hypothetical protein
MDTACLLSVRLLASSDICVAFQRGVGCIIMSARTPGMMFLVSPPLSFRQRAGVHYPVVNTLPEKTLVNACTRQCVERSYAASFRLLIRIHETAALVAPGMVQARLSTGFRSHLVHASRDSSTSLYLALAVTETSSQSGILG